MTLSLCFALTTGTTSRGTTSPVTRGNVVFELGLFLGALGADRTFVVYDTHKRPDVISDLEGIAFAPFDSSQSTILSAVGPACFLIKQKLKKHVAEQESSRILFLGPESTRQNAFPIMDVSDHDRHPPFAETRTTIV